MGGMNGPGPSVCSRVQPPSKPSFSALPEVVRQDGRAEAAGVIEVQLGIEMENRTKQR